jgi:prolyl oligopeptidase
MCLFAGLLASSAGARAMTTSATTTDPNLWLEDVEGKQALDWVRAQNVDSVKAIAEAPGFAETRDYLRSVLDSDAKIPRRREDRRHYYNFWKDKAHAAGCGAAPRLPNYAKPARRGKPCSTWTR